MRTGTKYQIAKLTLTVLSGVAFLFFLGVVVFVLCVGLQINPFRETTTYFLLASFAGVVGVAAVLVLVNVAANISLIADAQIEGLKIKINRYSPRKWIVGFLLSAAILTGIVFLGTYFSREKYLAVVHDQAEEVLNANKDLLVEIDKRLASGKYEDFKRISEICKYLENLRSGLPNFTLIYPGKFGEKLVFYEADSYFPENLKTQIYNHSYYRCTKNLDCDYLYRFFSDERVGRIEKYTVRDDQFYIYTPYIGEKSRFVLLFNSSNHYGKLGS